MASLQEKLNAFFDVVLRGESKTYNDHNWYANGKLRGYIQGRHSTPYSLLKKNLSDYTLGEVIAFQSRGRDNIGQLWATGRYQIIPNTLKGLKKSLQLGDNVVYNQQVQDAMGYRLLTERKPIRDYIEGKVEDNQKNLEEAAKSVAMIWSSVGVPHDMQGRRKYIRKNQSYYAGGGDVASVDTADVQNALRNFRGSKKTIGSGDKNKSINGGFSKVASKWWFLVGSIVIFGGLVALSIAKINKKA